MNSCIKRVGGELICKKCDGKIIKHGLIKGRQRYKCKSCKQTTMQNYLYKAYQPSINTMIVSFTKEGCGIKSISRLLHISATTVVKRIKLIAGSISKPMIPIGRKYQVDELKTYIKNKQNDYWVIYALDAEINQVVDYKVGKRSKENVKRVIDTLLFSDCKRISTDRLGIYRFLIPEQLHNRRRYCTNQIERKNLSLRTHLKRLNRKTICYSKSPSMLDACLRIYFWQGLGMSKG